MSPTTKRGDSKVLVGFAGAATCMSTEPRRSFEDEAPLNLRDRNPRLKVEDFDALVCNREDSLGWVT